MIGHGSNLFPSTVAVLHIFSNGTSFQAGKLIQPKQHIANSINI